jgi:hypothetical protein
MQTCLGIFRLTDIALVRGPHPRPKCVAAVVFKSRKSPRTLIGSERTAEYNVAMLEPCSCMSMFGRTYYGSCNFGTGFFQFLALRPGFAFRGERLRKDKAPSPITFEGMRTLWSVPVLSPVQRPPWTDAQQNSAHHGAIQSENILQQGAVLRSKYVNTTGSRAKVPTQPTCNGTKAPRVVI